MRWVPVLADGRQIVLVSVLLCAALVAGGCGEHDGLTGDPEPGPELLETLTRPANGDAVHLVRLVHRGDQYAFDPDTIRIAAGTAVRFVMGAYQPESVMFDPVAATPEAAAFIRANSLHLGVLMTEPGQTYDVSFRGAPPGVYPFLSRPHAQQGMRGVVEIVE